MSKPIATYLVKVTLRPGEGWPEGEPPKPPTNDELALAVVEGVKNYEGTAFEVTATSERTDI